MREQLTPADHIQIEGYRRMEPWRKLRQACDMAEFVRKVTLAEIRRENPGLSEQNCRVKLAERWLDPGLLQVALEHCRLRGYGS